MRKELGKISNVKFGKGGYQDVMFGLSLTFAFKGSGCGEFINGGWTYRSEGAKWTLEDRVKSMGDMTLRVLDLMEKAKVDDVMGLVGVPIEATFTDGFKLDSWRILEEVI